jgi:hypothetical protein
LSELVGWDSGRKDLLGTRDAYDLVNQTIYYTPGLPPRGELRDVVARAVRKVAARSLT